jgi:hypothetical protein
MTQAAGQPPGPHWSDDLPLDNYSLDFLLPLGSSGCQLDTILLTALASYKLEEEMLSSKLGIAGLADLHRVTTGLHNDLNSMLSDPNAPGETLRQEFSKFFFTFQELKGCTTQTAVAATMYQASRASKGSHLRVNQSLLAGIGSSGAEIEEMSSRAEATGKLSRREASLEDIRNMSNGDWIGLLGLSVAIMCYDENKEASFEIKRQELLIADLSSFNRCSEALAHILQLLQAATTAYGSPFMTNYDLFNLVKRKMNVKVQHEINDITATWKDLDLRKIEWYDIEELISDAWGTASRRPMSYYDRIIQAEPATQAKPAASTEIVHAIYSSPRASGSCD